MNIHAAHANNFRARVDNHFGMTWLALCAAQPFHLANESFPSFLTIYNPAVRTIHSLTCSPPFTTIGGS
ncbi:MAG TPA: hypothetical protein VIV66_16675, partial [Pyrinomonadaceae bacterium]